MSGQINAFEMAQKQFDAVAKQLKLDSGVAETLRWPMREYAFRIPVRMEDGSLKVFQGFRVQHNDARGPNKVVFASTRLRRSILCARSPHG